MPNTITYASIFQSELDKAAVEIAKTGWMELNDKLVKYDGGREVKIPKMSMDGMADYDDGFVGGAVSLTWQTKTMTMDRGRIFTIDEHDVNETNFALTASSVMGEYQRTKVIPEVDAYRLSAIATGAIAKSKATGGYTPSETDVLKKLYYDIAAVQDVIGDTQPLVITISTMVAAMIGMSTQLSRNIAQSDFKQGDVTLKVQSLDGQHPMIPVGSARLKTAYQFYDGSTTGQTGGGFVAATGAKDVNWIICPRDAAIAVSRTDKMRIFDPETYQDKRSWAMDYRKYHDIWIPDNKWDAIRVNIKQALS